MRLFRVPPIAAFGAAACLLPLRAGAMAPEHPPVAEVRPVTDTYFRTRITDPYRWMEGKPQTQFLDYLHAENDHARHVLASIPGRDALAREIGQVSGLAARVRNVALAGGRTFYLKREAGGQIDRLYAADGAGRETLLVDPSGLDRDGKHAEIDQFVPSQDGRLVVYGISIGGSENSRLHVIETATRTIRPDTIDRAQFANVSWTPDGQGFFFSRLPASAATATPSEQYAHMKVYRHGLGQDPAQDAVVLDSDHLPFPFKAAAVFPTVSVNPGSDYALAGVSPEVTLYSAPLKDVADGHPAWKQVALQSDDVIGAAVRGDRIDLLTHAHAPRFRVVESRLDAPAFAAA